MFEKSQTTERKLMVVADEAWQLLRSSEHLAVHERLAEKVVRVGRRYGFGVLTSTQQLEDVPQVFINSSALIFLHNYKEPEFSKRMIPLSNFDSAYMATAAQGECLVFDRLRAQQGQVLPDYVKVDPLSDKEYAELKGRAKQFEVPVIKEAEQKQEILPVEDGEKHLPQSDTRIPIPHGAPSPTEHAAMLAIYRNKSKDTTEIIKYIKDRDWILSSSTLYGYVGKPSVFDTIVRAGFAVESGGNYALTDKGLKWIEPEKILVNQSDKLGSEAHVRLLVKTIEKLHDLNMLVITSSAKHSFDLIAWPVYRKKRYLWDREEVRGYEIQTSARDDSISTNKEKAKEWGIPMVWVSDNEEVLGEIRKATGDSDEYVKID